MPCDRRLSLEGAEAAFSMTPSIGDVSMPCDRRLSLEARITSIRTGAWSNVSMPCDRRLSLEGGWRGPGSKRSSRCLTFQCRVTGVYPSKEVVEDYLPVYKYHVSMPCDRRLSLEAVQLSSWRCGGYGVSMPCDRRLSLEVPTSHPRIWRTVTFQCRVTGVYPSKKAYEHMVEAQTEAFQCRVTGVYPSKRTARK